MNVNSRTVTMKLVSNALHSLGKEQHFGGLIVVFSDLFNLGYIDS